MNGLPLAKRVAIVKALTEGMSIRATARLTGASKATVLKLLVELGEFCSIYQDLAHRNLKTERFEADEIWAFVGAKAKNATKEGQGDIWTYTALDADSKLMISWLVGSRNHANTHGFMADVAARLGNRVQLSTDGLGNPDMDTVSTSYVERSNLSTRMGIRRFTLLTNGFSKKAQNHAHAVSLYFMHYNYCRPQDAYQGGRRHQDYARDSGGSDGSRLARRGHHRADGPEAPVTLKLAHYREGSEVAVVPVSAHLTKLGATRRAPQKWGQRAELS